MAVSDSASIRLRLSIGMCCMVLFGWTQGMASDIDAAMDLPANAADNSASSIESSGTAAESASPIASSGTAAYSASSMAGSGAAAESASPIESSGAAANSTSPMAAFGTAAESASPIAGSNAAAHVHAVDGDSALAARVDAVANEWLASTAAPSVSVAIVKNGELTYAKAYGKSSLRPVRAATTDSRYALDSVTKEFTATAILLLAEEGKLSLDDPLRRWFPDLGAAGAATLRQVLTHTSGIRDYWPQDFVTPEMTRPTTIAGIVKEWASRPLDFEPGSEWQYSNTGFVLAAAVVERVSGESYFHFLQHHVFEPLGMARVADAVTTPAAEDAAGYTRYGLGPPQSAPKEGDGWLFGAANLVMSPSDVARWDLGLMNRSLLQPASYDVQFAPLKLRSGMSIHYGLGLDIEEVDGRLRIGHSGSGSGFLADNRLWPTEHTAIVVLTNSDWATPSDLSDRIAFLLLPPSPAARRARDVFAAFQRGTLDRSLFTEIGNFYLSATVLQGLQASLAPLGPLRLLELERESQRGGLVTRRWKALCARARLEILERGVPGGKLEQFMVLERRD